MYLHVVCDSLLLLVCNKSKTKERDAEVGRHTTSPLPDSEAEDKEEEYLLFCPSPNQVSTVGVANTRHSIVDGKVFFYFSSR